MAMNQAKVSDMDLAAWEKVQFNESHDEKQNRIAQEQVSSLQIVQRKKRIELLIEKRKLNFAYIKKLHQGGLYFLNSVMVSKEDVYKVVAQKDVDHRARMFYYLGLSICPLLDLTNGPNTVRAFSQLLEEWEYMFDSAAAVQGVKYMMATTSNSAYPEFLPFEGDGDQLRSSIFRFKDDVVYEYLLLPHLPFVPDYLEVMSSLCDMLSMLYENMNHKDTYGNSVLYEAVVRLDTRIKHYVVSSVAKEFTANCVKDVQGELKSLRGVLNGEHN
mmetsp:Transcript_17359/g.29055  ORF Transcript_17359/g.29055 Transcript_17359/m.29055 type:complete len:272 (-) Transcript_17359:2070-2885(-)